MSKEFTSLIGYPLEEAIIQLNYEGFSIVNLSFTGKIDFSFSNFRVIRVKIEKEKEVSLTVVQDFGRKLIEQN